MTMKGKEYYVDSHNQKHYMVSDSAKKKEEAEETKKEKVPQLQTHQSEQSKHGMIYSDVLTNRFFDRV